VRGRVGEHRLEAQSGGLLGLGLLGDRRAGGRDVGAQGVALGLQGGQAEHPRPGVAAPRRDRRAGDDRLSELALHPRDLGAEVRPCGASDVGGDEDRLRRSFNANVVRDRDE